MNGPTIGELAKRLDRLQSHHDLLQFLVVVSWALFIIVIAFNRYRFFGPLSLMNLKGRFRLTMDGFKENALQLHFWDKDQKVRLSLGLRDDGSPFLDFHGDDDRRTLMATYSAENKALFFALPNENGDLVMISKTSDDGFSTSFNLNSKSGSISLISGTEGPLMAFTDKNNQNRLGGTITPEGHPQMELLNESGKRRFWFGSDESGAARMVWLDKNDKPRIHLGLYANDEPFFYFLDENGDPIASNPPKKDPPESGEPAVSP